MNDKTRLLCGFRKCRTDRVYLVNRCVSRVELTRQVVKARIATCLSDFPFLRGSHFLGIKLTPGANVAQASHLPATQRQNCHSERSEESQESIRDVSLRST